MAPRDLAALWAAPGMHSAIEGKKDQNYWTRLGAAWANNKGGFNIKLNAVPLNGELVLLPPKDE